MYEAGQKLKLTVTCWNSEDRSAWEAVQEGKEFSPEHLVDRVLFRTVESVSPYEDGQMLRFSDGTAMATTIEGLKIEIEE